MSGEALNGNQEHLCTRCGGDTLDPVWDALDLLNGSSGTDPGDDTPKPEPMELVSLAEFVAVDEPGADALVGEGPDNAFIPQGGDTMLYGDGGAGKTTLSIDLAFHLAAGKDWIGIPIRQSVRPLLVENEGSRPHHRRKLKRKVDAWDGKPVDGPILVYERPWRQFTFATEHARQQLAEYICEYRIDVIIAGPLTRIGMDANGTLHEVRAFMELIDDLRDRCDRPIAVILVHHEGKSGSVSGAWEGAGDTLLHVQGAGNGKTVVHVQKARCDSSRHGRTFHLNWAPGEGFAVEGDRDLKAEVIELLGEHDWLTVKQMAAPRDARQPGLGAGEDRIRDVLADTDVFEMRTGDAAVALGRASKAKLYGLRWGSSAVNAVGAPLLRSGDHCASALPVRERSGPDARSQNGAALRRDVVAVDAEPPSNGWSDDDLQALVDHYGDGGGDDPF